MNAEDQEMPVPEELDETQETPVSQDTPTEENTETEVSEDPPTLEEEILKWRDAALRSAAELENYRKRMAREKSDAIRFANQRLLSELLPVLDNFEMGMMAAQNEKDSMIYMGMNMVQKQISDFLENMGVTPVKAEGEFDPTLHEAVSEEVSQDVPAGHILRVMRRGFNLNDRLLRPATVVVAKNADDEEKSADSTEETEA